MSVAASGKTAVLASALALALGASPLVMSGPAQAADDLYILGGGGGGGAETGNASGGGGGGTVFMGPNTDSVIGGKGADGDVANGGGAGVGKPGGTARPGADAGTPTSDRPGSGVNSSIADATAGNGDPGVAAGGAGGDGGKGGDASLNWTGADQSIGQLYLMGGNAGTGSTTKAGGAGGKATLDMTGKLTLDGGLVQSGQSVTGSASGGDVDFKAGTVAFSGSGSGQLEFKKQGGTMEVTIGRVEAVAGDGKLVFDSTAAGTGGVTIGRFVIGGGKTLTVQGSEGANNQYTLTEGLTVSGTGGKHNFSGGLTLKSTQSLAFENLDVASSTSTTALVEADGAAELILNGAAVTYDAASQASVDTKLTGDNLGSGLLLVKGSTTSGGLAGGTFEVPGSSGPVRKYATVLHGASKDLVVYKSFEQLATLDVSTDASYSATYGDIEHKITGAVTLKASSAASLLYAGPNKATVTGGSLVFNNTEDQTFSLAAGSGSTATFNAVTVTKTGIVNAAADNTVTLNDIALAADNTLKLTGAGTITLGNVAATGKTGIDASGFTGTTNPSLAGKTITFTLDQAGIDPLYDAGDTPTAWALTLNKVEVTAGTTVAFANGVADLIATKLQGGGTIGLVTGLTTQSGWTDRVFGSVGAQFVVTQSGNTLVVRKSSGQTGTFENFSGAANFSDNVEWVGGEQGQHTAQGGGSYTNLKTVTFAEGFKVADGKTATFKSGDAAGKDLTVTTGGDKSVSGNIVLEKGAGELNINFGVLDATQQNTTLTLIKTEGAKTVIGKLAIGGGYTLTIKSDKDNPGDFLNAIPVSITGKGGNYDIFRDVAVSVLTFDYTEAAVTTRATGQKNYFKLESNNLVFTDRARQMVAAGINRDGTSLVLVEGVVGDSFAARAFTGAVSAPVGDGSDAGSWSISHLFNSGTPGDVNKPGQIVAWATSVSSENVTYSASRTFTPTYGSFTQTVGSASKPGTFTITGGARLVYGQSGNNKATLDLTNAGEVRVQGFGNAITVGADSKVDLKGKAVFFIADAPVDVSTPMLTLSTPTDVSIDGARIELSSVTDDYSGGRVDLLRIAGGGKLTGTTQDGVITIGEGIINRTAVPVNIVNETDLWADVDGGNVDTRGGHGYVLQAFATQTVLNQAGDTIADISGSIVPLPGTEVWWNGEIEAVGFATLGGYWNELSPASKVKTRGFSFAGGPGVRLNHEAGPLNIIAFLESGWGDYDTEHTFWGGHGTGEGKTVYMGGGVLARQDFLMGLYLEGSLRGGWVSNDFENRNVAGGTDLKTDAGYFGGHLGLGYEFPVAYDQGSIDLYGKFLWTYVGDTDGRVNATQRVDIDSSTSLRTRLGIRYAHELDYNFRGYVGAAWEQEFDGEVEGHVRNVNGTVAHRLPSADVRGATGVFEAGLNYYADSGVTLNGRIFGSVGERDSFGGKISANFAF